jgi:hypothetical protein
MLVISGAGVLAAALILAEKASETSAGVVFLWQIY